MQFIRRNEPDHAMVSVVLRSIEGRVRGEVFLPMGEQGGVSDASAAPAGGPLAAGEALGLATAHAFDQRTDVAIVDAEGLWRPEWGTLHAPPDAAPEVEAAAAALSGEGPPETEVADPAEAGAAEPADETGPEEYEAEADAEADAEPETEPTDEDAADAGIEPEEAESESEGEDSDEAAESPR